MKLYPEYLSKDRHYDENDIFPAIDALDVMSHGCHLYGYIMTPGGKPAKSTRWSLSYTASPDIAPTTTWIMLSAVWAASL